MKRRLFAQSDHMAVHTVHQHDAPGSDLDTERLLAEHGLGGRSSNAQLDHRVFQAIADAARDCLTQAESVTQVGFDSGKIESLRIGTANVLHMPAELFIEYQIAAQQIRPDRFIAMTAYGDNSPSHIGTEIAYTQGGHEVGDHVSRVSPAVEKVLKAAIKQLLSTSV